MNSWKKGIHPMAISVLHQKQYKIIHEIHREHIIMYKKYSVRGMCYFHSILLCIFLNISYFFILTRNYLLDKNLLNKKKNIVFENIKVIKR